LDKIRNWLARRLPTRRRLIQLYAALLYNANLRGFVEGDIYTGGTKRFCVPGLNCYSCPGAVGACPLGALQNALASSNHRAPYYVLGLLALFGLLLGRLICGFLCPMGLIQELLHKIPTPKVRKSRFTRILSYLKYVILALFVVWIPLVYAAQSYPVPAFCKYICPAGTLEGAVGLLSNPANADKFSMLGLLFTRKFVILLAIVLACVFLYRAFCRFLCPLGAIYGFFCRVALLGVKLDRSGCIDCGKCIRTCKMDVRRVGDHECIHCGACMDGCPTKAISWKGGKVTVRGNDTPAPAKKKRGREAIAWILALAVLTGALWYFNRPAEPAVQPPAVETSDLPVGSEVGMRCPDFTAEIYGGGTFELSQTRGRVVVINFWATWCTPCVAELPHFQQLWENYSGDVEVIALHSHLVTDDVQAYLDQQGYTMPFALDADGEVIEGLGGSTMLPMTVVLDRTGTIVYNQVGSVDYEALEQLVKPLL